MVLLACVLSFCDVWASSPDAAYLHSHDDVSEVIEIASDRKKCNCAKDKTDEEIRQNDINAENAGKNLAAAYLVHKNVAF